MAKETEGKTAKMPADIAEQEVIKWMDYKKIGDHKREAKTDDIKNMVEAICNGNLVLKDDFTFVQTLKFPIPNEINTESLTHKARVAVHVIHTQLQGVKVTDIGSFSVAYVAAITGKPKDVVRALDPVDFELASSIAAFF